jgi:hypothetical protein
MRGALDFLLLTVRCVIFIWAVATVLILILFAVGSEAEGYGWGERIFIAIRYAGYVGGIFGSLLALTLSLKTWRIERANQKKLARRHQSREKTNPS